MRKLVADEREKARRVYETKRERERERERKRVNLDHRFVFDQREKIS